ncbi:MAG: hypothetical protein R6V54_07705 [Desulfobacteraceae bacterium]
MSSPMNYYRTDQKNKQIVLSCFGGQGMHKPRSSYVPVRNTHRQPAGDLFYFKAAEEKQKRIVRAIANYEVEGRPDVVSFLQRNPDIIKAVNQTYAKVLEFFKDVDRIFLEVSVDPEDNSKSLIATVFTGLDVDSALDKLDEFDRQWFSAQAMQSEILFNVLLAFKE